MTARSDALADLGERLDVLVAEVSAAALPFDAVVSIWHSANDGCLKWAIETPVA